MALNMNEEVESGHVFNKSICEVFLNELDEKKRWPLNRKKWKGLVNKSCQNGTMRVRELKELGQSLHWSCGCRFLICWFLFNHKNLHVILLVILVGHWTKGNKKRNRKKKNEWNEIK